MIRLQRFRRPLNRRVSESYWLSIAFAAVVMNVFWLTTGTLAHAQAIRDLPGFHSNTLQRNDDGSTGAVPIGFTLNFFDKKYTQLYVNNNGNVTFDGPLGQYVPFGLAGTNLPIIAAFFADVDTRPLGSDEVSYGTDTVEGRQAFGVDYFRVGYYSEMADRLNTFQIVLISRPDTGEDNFDIELNYSQITWDQGSLSHNVSAVAGYSNGSGNQNSLFQLSGSMLEGAFLDGGPNSLVSNRLNSSVPGRYVFEVRSGEVRLLRITTDGLPEGTVLQPYSSPPLALSGGVAPYAWSTVNWPDGLGVTLDPSTGVISGTPAHVGTYQLTVRASDQASTPAASKTFTLVVKSGSALHEVPHLGSLL